MEQNRQILQSNVRASTHTKEIGVRVKIDSTVSILFDTGRELTITIKTPRETNPSIGIVSYESPLGKSLLDKQEGDKFEYAVTTRKFSGKVVKIHLG